VNINSEREQQLDAVNMNQDNIYETKTLTQNRTSN